jgi:hypothetical protein
MPRTSIRAIRPLWLFLVILLLGIPLTTAGYRLSRLSAPNQPIEETLTERHKQLASAEGDMSKWLLGLASGALASLIALRFKDPDNKSLLSAAPMTAYAFLIISIYGAFLSYEANIDILQTGPLLYMYSDQFRFPVLVQFWSLFVALLFLGVWIFRPNSEKVALPVAVLLFVCLTPANAQTVDLNKCATNWYADRLPKESASPDLAISVLQKLEKQPGAKNIATCVDADAVLDQLRLAASLSDDTTLREHFSKYLEALVDELSHPGLSMSNVVHTIVQLMSPWDSPLGVLSVRSSKNTFTILIDAQVVGITNWCQRLPPGTYRIRVARNLTAVYSEDHFTLAAGDNKVIDVDRLQP